MKLINNQVYLTTQNCEECGIATDGYIRKAKSEGIKCWDIINDPDDLRRNLVGFEALNDDRKRKVELRFGNPYDLVARTPILNMVVNDWKANEHYMRHRYDNNTKSLDPCRVYQYTRAAGWLNMICQVQDDKRIVKKDLNLTIPEFYTHVASLISIEKGRGKLKGYAGLDVLPGDFPSSYQRLIAKAMNYKEQGYDSLIDPLYGNKNAAKIGKSLTPALSEGEGEALGMPLLLGTNDLIVRDKEGVSCLEVVKKEQKSANKGGAFDPELAEEQMAVIRTVCRQAQNLDAGQVCGMVNIIFELKGWKPLSRAWFHDFITKNKHLLTAGRKGMKKHDSTIAMQVKRKRPDMPLKFLTMDGWLVELMYQERRAASGKRAAGTDYKRLMLVVVLDTYNDYPVGYAIGDRENTELIRMANRNAMLHIKELFGEYYRPWQMQSDNYGIKQLTPFYQAMGHLHTPAAVGNAKAKPIEPYFGRINKKHCQHKQNWSGFNVTAKQDNQVSPEHLNKIKHLIPDKEGVIKQIIAMMNAERREKVAAYTSQWPLYEAHGGRPEIMNDMNWLQVFGMPLGDRTNRITGQGIIKTINGAEHTYDSYDPAFRANLHIDWKLYGDEYDMSRVLAVSPDETLKFVLQEKRILPMDVRSMSEEDHAELMNIRHFNKERKADILQTYIEDAELAYEVIASTPLDMSNDTELAIKGMFVKEGQQKDLLQDAKGLRQAQVAIQRKEQKRIAADAVSSADEWEKRRLAFLHENTDFSKYAL